MSTEEKYETHLGTGILLKKKHSLKFQITGVSFKRSPDIRNNVYFTDTVLKCSQGSAQIFI